MSPAQLKDRCGLVLNFKERKYVKEYGELYSEYKRIDGKRIAIRNMYKEEYYKNTPQYNALTKRWMELSSRVSKMAYESKKYPVLELYSMYRDKLLTKEQIIIKQKELRKSTGGATVIDRIKDYLLSSLGFAGVVLYFVLGLAISILPILMFDIHWIAYLILCSISIFVLSKIPFATEILWIIGLFGAISGKQDIFAIIYYVMFAIIIGSFIYKLIVILRSDN
jgi:hypothetical protein